MRLRKLLDGTEVAEFDTPVILTVKTKCPSKWLLIDQETGEKYTGYETEGKNSWRKLVEDGTV